MHSYEAATWRDYDVKSDDFQLKFNNAFKYTENSFMSWSTLEELFEGVRGISYESTSKVDFEGNPGKRYLFTFPDYDEG